jgi:hypothetical protein
VRKPLWQSAAGIEYELMSSGQRDGRVILRFNRQSGGVNGIYLPTSFAHLAALSNLSNILDMVHSDEARVSATVSDGMYRLWNRSTSYNYGFDISGSSVALDNNGNATVFGVDGKSFLLDGGSMFVPAIFIGCSRENFYHTKNSHSNSSLGGLKLSWLNRDYGKLSMVCSYGAVRTGNKDCKLHSHTIFLSTRYGNNLPLRDDLSIVPVVQFDYSKVFFNGIKTKNFQVESENTQSLRLSTGMDLQLNLNNFLISVGARLNRKFGMESIGKFENPGHSPAKISTSCVEFGGKIGGKIGNISVDLAVGKSCGERRGTALNLVLSSPF